MPTNPPQKKKRIRTALGKNRKGILVGMILAAIVAVVLIADDDPPKVCPIEDVVQEEVNLDQELHEHSQETKVGLTLQTCSFQTPDGANKEAVRVEIFTYDNVEGPKTQIDAIRTAGFPVIHEELSSRETEDGGYRFVRDVPTGRNQKRQELVRAYPKDNRLCVVTIWRPLTESTPDDLDRLRIAADSVATAAFTPTTD